MTFYHRLKPALASSVRSALLVAACSAGLLSVGFRLRGLAFVASPSISLSIDIIGVFLTFTFAANALVRFRGTRDRTALILATGFGLVGLMELGLTVGTMGNLAFANLLTNRISVIWIEARLLLALALVLAPVAEEDFPLPLGGQRAEIPKLALVGMIWYACSAIYVLLIHLHIQPEASISRPWQLLPAVLFLFAAVSFQDRQHLASSALDTALVTAAWLNLGSHLLLMESARLFDAPFALAQLLRVSSYAMVLGGTLIDNSRLFSQVQQLAISDSLTGLANYRRLVDVLDSEIERSGRTGREFSILLLDLDGLKAVNDRHGHLVGSRALCRLAEVLRVHSRAMDTAARYGGDEFALILPETGGTHARLVADRVRARLSTQSESPQLSVSIGVATYPTSGVTADRLLVAADKALYEMKIALSASKKSPTPN